MIARLDKLALECDELAVELHAVATPRLEAALGMSSTEMINALRSVDPAIVADPAERQQLEAILALGDVDLDELDLS